MYEHYRKPMANIHSKNLESIDKLHEYREGIKVNFLGPQYHTLQIFKGRLKEGFRQYCHYQRFRIVVYQIVLRFR